MIYALLVLLLPSVLYLILRLRSKIRSDQAQARRRQEQYTEIAHRIPPAWHERAAQGFEKRFKG